VESSKGGGMKLEDMPTPETDACAKRCRDNLPFALASQNPIESIGDVVTAAHARMLEQRLGLMVAALKECYSGENADRRKGERRKYTRITADRRQK